MTEIRDPINIQVQQWVSRAKEKAEQALQATATDALARVKELTPVVTGNLRANWQISIEGEPLQIDQRAASTPELIASLSILGKTIVIENPTVYAARVEYGFTGTDSLGRHYNQMGHFMMTQTILELPKIAAAATKRVVEGRT